MTIGASSCLAIPTWSGWKTLVFVPMTTAGFAPAMSVMHAAAPLEDTWTPDRPATVLSDRLHWAVLDDVKPPSSAAAIIAATSPSAP